MKPRGDRMLALFTAAAGVAGCSRADLYAVTREASTNTASAVSTGATTTASTSTGGASTAGTSTASTSTGGASTAGTSTTGEGGSGNAGDDCPELVLEPGDSNRNVRVDGQMRSYTLHVPPGYDGRTRVPLVLDFHGVGESGMSHRSSSPYPAALDADGVVMAFPDGLSGPAGTAWNVGPCCVAEVDDVAFARALVAQVQTNACIDASRIYAVGVLTGGGMAHYLACHAADLFAAVAPAAFDLLQENLGDCAPARPITVVSFRGTDNNRVPYEGGRSALVPGMPITFLGAEATFEAWSSLDGCVGSASPRDADGCSAYSGCADGTEVILCTKEGGAEEPGDPAIAWPVLRRHRL